MDFKEEYLTLDLFNLGVHRMIINKSHTPRTIAAIEKALPIKSRGIKRSAKFTINTIVKTRNEKEKKSFGRGEIALEPSSGNIIIFLDDINLDRTANHFGFMENIEKINEIRLSQGLEIR